MPACSSLSSGGSSCPSLSQPSRKTASHTSAYKEAGRMEGFTEGRTEGENALAALMTKLFSLGRVQDAELAAKDPEARKRFYLEFGIGDEQ